MKKTVIFLLVCLLLTAAPFPARSYAAEEDAVSAAADDVDSVFVRVRLSTGGAQRVCIAVEGTYRCNGTPFTGGTLTLRLRGEHVTVTHSELGLLSDNPFIYIERLDPDPWEAFFTLDNARYGECRYLGDLFSPERPDRPDTLVLGCTHFPLFREALRHVVGDDVRIVDSAETAAVAVENRLRELDLLRGEDAPGSHRFMTTDNVLRFIRTGSLFLGHPLKSAEVSLVDLS